MRKDLLHLLIIAIFIMGTHTIAKPFFADYHYRRAINIKGTQWPEAIVAYRKAINLDPSNAAYHAKLGHLYLSRSRRLPALTSDSQRTTDNGQQSVGIHNSRMNFLSSAEQSYKKAIDLCPQNGNYWLGMGMVYEQMGFIPRSEFRIPNSQVAASYQKAISLDPNNAFFRTMLGSFHIRNGNKEEGLEQYEKAITSLPRLQLYDFLNNKDVKDEFLDAAIKGLRKAIKLYPRDPDIYHQLGSIYIKKGLYNQAIEQYEHAVKLKPEHKGFKRTLYSLKNQYSSH